MTLGQKQRIFTRLVGVLIEWTYQNGYELTFSEAYRTPEQAAIYAKQGKGIKNSLHTKRLAIDLNLFKNGVYLTRSEDYLPLGMVWEQMSGPGYQCCWGGRFKRPDGNHFSIEHEGIK
jgi:hypothetical protein